MGDGRRARTRSSLVFSLLAAGLVAAGIASGTGCVGNAPAKGCTTNCTPEPTLETAETTRFPRLSHLQWENTVRDLLYLSEPTGLSDSFTRDAIAGMFDNDESSLLVTPGLWSDYQLAAEDLADMMTSDPLKLAKIVPPDAAGGTADRARAFIEQFGARAYRRALTQAEVDAYVALFSKGPAVFEGNDDFTSGVRLVLEAFLQSPNFIYRVQSSTEVASNGLIPLSGYEIATKLSYMLWNTMPDDALFASAAAGTLDTADGVLGEAQRLLADDRAKAMVASFHRQLFQYNLYDDLNKDATLFPTFSAAYGADMKREAELFIEDVIFSDSGGIREILTEPTTFVNDKLAPIYGVAGSFTSDFVKVSLDPAQRSGFLTHIGFLASNATARDQHSIHRGVFVNRRILCATLPDPPNNITPLPAPMPAQTNRQRVEDHTGKGTCGESCHGALINPAGFAFEHYDAIGGYQTMENGLPIDSSDAYPLDGKQVAYNDAIDFDALIGQSDMAHDCYAQHWIEYAYGRSLQSTDDASLPDLAAKSREGTKALILALTQTTAFRSRAPIKKEQQ